MLDIPNAHPLETGTGNKRKPSFEPRIFRKPITRPLFIFYAVPKTALRAATILIPICLLIRAISIRNGFFLLFRQRLDETFIDDIDMKRAVVMTDILGESRSKTFEREFLFFNPVSIC